MTEDEMVGWHHRLNGHEFEQALGDDEGQESLACCSPWGHKESYMTEQLNGTELKLQSGPISLILVPRLFSHQNDARLSLGKNPSLSLSFLSPFPSSKMIPTLTDLPLYHNQSSHLQSKWPQYF